MQSLIDEGRITEEEAAHPPAPQPDPARASTACTRPSPTSSCSSSRRATGSCCAATALSGVLDDDRLADILGTGTVDYAVVELVRASLDAGSTDNVTCVVADVVDDGAADDAEPARPPRGPMLVGAAAEQPRRAGRVRELLPRPPQRRHRRARAGAARPTTSRVDPEELRYAPAGAAPVPLARGVVVVAGRGCSCCWPRLESAAYRWSQKQYYVAADGDQVAIFRASRPTCPGVTLLHVVDETSRRHPDAAGLHRPSRSAPASPPTTSTTPASIVAQPRATAAPGVVPDADPHADADAAKSPTATPGPASRRERDPVRRRRPDRPRRRRRRR